MQIDANFVNDYFDFAHGIDDEQRLGPKRACAQGWITPKAMLWGITIITMMACIVGLPLIAWGGWECIIVGVACVVFCFLYTTLFSRIAMGIFWYSFSLVLYPLVIPIFFRAIMTPFCTFPWVYGCWHLPKVW
jgi:1,4-dihydroxy-2-naphthoate octaprenyltransferase